jgi:hypothetical protein
MVVLLAAVVVGDAFCVIPIGRIHSFPSAVVSQAILPPKSKTTKNKVYRPGRFFDLMMFHIQRLAEAVATIKKKEISLLDDDDLLIIGRGVR